MRYRHVKPILDYILSLTALILLSPIFLMVSLGVLFTMGRPILYRQKRAGLNGCVFRIIKFRTMLETVDASGGPLPDEQRLTAMGSFLRTTSLDELPELLNVLKGEMSLVGPRPLYVKYLEWYSDTETRRHAAKPGITGWAQVNGRNYLPWSERLALDVWYVENISCWLDMKILLKTIHVVLVRKGAAANPDEVEVDLDIERAEQLLSGGETS